MCFYVFAGPNGSGKSTIISQFIQSTINIAYVCADEISKEADFANISDERARNFESMMRAEEMVKHKLSLKEPVIYETVLSSDYKWPLFDFAFDNQIKIVVTYITTRDPEINVERVRKRVKMGGHPVPEEKIRKRYAECHARIEKALVYADAALIYDNSTEGSSAPRIVLAKEGKNVEIRQECEWLVKLSEGWNNARDLYSVRYI